MPKKLPKSNNQINPPLESIDSEGKRIDAPTDVVLYGRVEGVMPIEVKGMVYKGRRGLSIMKVFFKKSVGEFRPTGKGIFLQLDDFNDIMVILTDNEEEIEKYLKRG